MVAKIVERTEAPDKKTGKTKLKPSQANKPKITKLGITEKVHALMEEMDYNPIKAMIKDAKNLARKQVSRRSNTEKILKLRYDSILAEYYAPKLTAVKHSGSVAVNAGVLVVGGTLTQEQWAQMIKPPIDVTPES